MKLHKPSIKVMSFNIQHGASPDGVYDLEKTAEVIRQSGADVIGLQEVDRYYSNRSKGEDTIGRLSSMLGMHYAYGANVDRPPVQPGLPRSQYGTAVLSKYPMVQQHNHSLTSYGQEPRGLLETLIKVNGISVYFYCTHLGLDAEQQQTQTEEILSLMAQKQNHPLLLVGDFNATPDSSDIRRLAQLFQEPFADQPYAYTFDSRNPHAKIDYIWANDKWLLGDRHPAQVIPVQASDHFPIVCDLYLKP
jgi:endonuclease/exonuclease/phosphatase family metal-dependent hydrolase